MMMMLMDSVNCGWVSVIVKKEKGRVVNLLFCVEIKEEVEWELCCRAKSFAVSFG